MPRRSERVPLDHGQPGTRRELIVHRYGAPGARPKAYLQASLHADEIPAMLVAHHLLRRLDAAETAGAVVGEVVVVPYANPLGLDQFINAQHLGRHELGGAGNFNRNWPDLYTPIAEGLGQILTDSRAENVARVRAAMREFLDARTPVDETDSLRLALARQAVDADLVLDLHCDEKALMHLYLTPAHWPEAQDLAAELGCRAVLLAEDSGGASFDEAFSTPWIRLAARYPDRPIPAACLAGTVELRGQADVSDVLATEDSAALFRALQRHGAITGSPGPVPEPSCEATRLDACEILRAPAPGILTYAVELGQHVRRGDVVAWLTDPAALDPATARCAVRASTDGLLVSCRDRLWVRPNAPLAKVVGKEPLPEHAGGYLLDD